MSAERRPDDSMEQADPSQQIVDSPLLESMTRAELGAKVAQPGVAASLTAAQVDAARQAGRLFRTKH